MKRLLAALLFFTLACGLARAADCVDSACVTVGSRTVAVDNRRSAVFNATAEQLTGAPVNLAPAEWQALADARVTFADIAEAMRDAGSTLTDEQIVGTRFTLRELFDAAAQAALARGDTAAAAALQALPVDSLKGTVSLGDLTAGEGSGDAALSLLDLSSGLLAQQAYESAAPPPAPSILSGEALGLDGVVRTVEFSAIVAEEPTLVCGPAGSEFRSAGMRFKLGVDLEDQDLSGALAAEMASGGVVLPAGASAPQVSFTGFTLYGVVGQAEGSIAAVDALAQAVTLRARPGVVDLYLGEIDDAVFFDRTRQLRAASDLAFGEVGRLRMDVNGTTVTAAVRARSHASGAPAGYETLDYFGPYPETQTVAPDPFFAENLTDSFVDNLEFEIEAIDPAPLDAASQLVFDQAVAAMQESLATTFAEAAGPVVRQLAGDAIDPALEFFGVRLGEADLTVTGVHRECGPGPHAWLLPDHARNAAPGAVVFYPHRFEAEVAGAVRFSTEQSAGATAAGWSRVLYCDLNANGAIEPGEPVLDEATTVNVAAGETVALVAKVFVPATAAPGQRETLRVSAEFTSTEPAGAAPEMLTRTDTTTVGGAALTLVKQVDKTEVPPGDTLTYTVVYTNHGAEPMRSVALHDATPAFTSFVSATAPATPPGLGAASFTTPAVGETGAIRWEFPGELPPGASGSITFTVRVAQ